MIDKMNTEMKEESKNSKSAKGSNDTGLSIETLKQMGYKHPLTVSWVIEAIEQGKDLKDIKSGFIESRIATKQNGHILFVFILSGLNGYHNEIESEIRMMDRKDFIFFIDREWVPSNDGRLLRKVFEAICDGKTVKEALECLKEEETEAPTKPEEDTPAPANHDPTMEEVDLRNAVSFCKDIFVEKSVLYGRSFDEMHPETVTDQLFMKATILKKQLTDRDKSQRLGFAFFEGIRDEFAAVVNYGVIALWQGGFGVQSLVPEAPIKFYMDQMNAALSLISDKGADYGELWRKQRIGTLADMIYTKVRRLKGIEDQYRFGSMTKEGYHKFAGDQYRDLINYGLFGVVRMTEIADVMAFEMEEDETDEEEGYE